MDYETLKISEELRTDEDVRIAYGKRKDNPENFPVFQNSRPVSLGLNVTDLSTAAYLAGMNQLIVGGKGSGKSQLVQDFYNYYFGGNIKEGGQGVKIRGRPDLDIYSEIYTKLDKEKLGRVPTECVRGMIHWADEFNRCTPLGENQFLGLGDGFLEDEGSKLKLGKDGYSIIVATANFGNGEYKGTSATDAAMMNRFGISLNFDDPRFHPSERDKMFTRATRPANPDIKEAPIRNITDLLIKSKKEIAEETLNPGTEAWAAMQYIEFGLANCMEYGKKGEAWPMKCQDCPHRQKDESILCSLIKSPVERTLQSTLLYASALDHLAKIKNPKISVNPSEAVFTAFELVSAYHSVLNQGVLSSKKYFNQNSMMMKDVSDALREDFNSRKDEIISALESGREGKKPDDLFLYKKKIGYGYSKLDKTTKETLEEESPVEKVVFDNSNAVGLEWVVNSGRFLGQIEKSKNTKKSRSKKPKHDNQKINRR